MLAAALILSVWAGAAIIAPKDERAINIVSRPVINKETGSIFIWPEPFAAYKKRRVALRLRYIHPR
ncbi:hypothetical protein [Pantoea agglomerans]|uniref:hypothetical protein n=1 Tax=Enterobacter agglomerans TaxID=549 RepID=UPI0011B052AB|nr:hypothetical protein [Pantoea agglomerans]UBN56172.1 hypothetical protein LB453_11820 [Pantoea agglomerans]